MRGGEQVCLTNHCSWNNIPDDVKGCVGWIVELIIDTFGQDILSLYLLGSVVRGDYVKNVSDLDVRVVVGCKNTSYENWLMMALNSKRSEWVECFTSVDISFWESRDVTDNARWRMGIDAVQILPEYQEVCGEVFVDFDFLYSILRLSDFNGFISMHRTRFQSCPVFFFKIVVRKFLKQLIRHIASIRLCEERHYTPSIFNTLDWGRKRFSCGVVDCVGELYLSPPEFSGDASFYSYFDDVLVGLAGKVFHL